MKAHPEAVVRQFQQSAHLWVMINGFIRGAWVIWRHGDMICSCNRYEADEVVYMDSTCIKQSAIPAHRCM